MSDLKLTKNDLKKLSLEFRTVSSRLLRSSYDDVFENICRFVTFLEENPLINSYLSRLPVLDVDWPHTIESRRHRDSFVLPRRPDEEAAYILGLLKWLIKENRSLDNFYLGYGTGSKLQDHLDGFNRRVTSHLVNHISKFIVDLQIEGGFEGSSGNVNVHVAAPVQQLNLATNNSSVTANNFNQPQLAEVNLKAHEALRLLETDETFQGSKDEIQEMIDIALQEGEKKKPTSFTVKAVCEKLSFLASTVKMSAESAQALLSLSQTIYKLLPP